MKIVYSFSSTKKLARNVAKKLNCKFSEIIVKDFPDEESYVRFKENPKGRDVFIFNSFSRDQNNRLIETILACGIARDYGAKKVFLVAPYFPYLRQDTHFEKLDSFSIKYVSPLLRCFDKVFVVDPHLQRIKNIKKISKNFERLTSVGPIADFIRKKIGGDFTIVGPDKESKQWAQDVAERLNRNAIILKKKRKDWHNVKIEKKNLGKRVIIIDDIVGTGNTILETVKVAKIFGAKEITIIGIHGVLVENAGRKIRKYAELFTTNTIENEFSKIDISPLIAESLK